MLDRTPMLDHAMALAALGFHVFPVKAGAKHPPLIENFPERATRDKDQIWAWWRQWPHANVAISTTKFGEDRALIAVDGDTKKGGLATLTLMDLPATCMQSTPNGGVHLFYLVDEAVKQGVDLLGPGVDVRSRGGYVLAHGSQLADGKTYVMDTTPPAEAPDWLIRRLASPVAAPKPVIERAALGELDTRASIARAIAYLMDDAPVAVEGAHGDGTTYRVACVVKDIGISESTCLALMHGHWNDRCRPPWPGDELFAKVKHAYRYGQNPPGAMAPERQFTPVPALPAPVATRRRGRHGDDWRSVPGWMLKGLLPKRGTGAMVGPSGSGKSLLALHLARQLATKEAFFGIEPKAAVGTIILACEGAGTMPARLAALPPAPDGKPLPIYWLETGNLADRNVRIALIAELRAIAEAMQRDFGVAPGLLVIDTWRASGLLRGENAENDNSVVAAAIRAVDEMAGAIGAFALVIHHPRKSGDAEAGAGAFRAALDALIWIERDGLDPVRGVRLDKSRDAEERDLGSFSVEAVPLGKDADGDTVTSATIKPMQGLAGDLGGGRVHRLTQALVDTVAAAVADNGDSPVGEQTVRALFDLKLPVDQRADSRLRTFRRCLQDAIRTRQVFRVAVGARVKLTTDPSMSAKSDFDEMDDQ